MKESNLIHTFLNQLETVFRKKLDEILGTLSIREKDDEKSEIFNFYEWIIVRTFYIYLIFFSMNRRPRKIFMRFSIRLKTNCSQ